MLITSSRTTSSPLVAVLSSCTSDSYIQEVMVCRLDLGRKTTGRSSRDKDAEDILRYPKINTRICPREGASNTDERKDLHPRAHKVVDDYGMMMSREAAPPQHRHIHDGGVHAELKACIAAVRC